MGIVVCRLLYWLHFIMNNTLSIQAMRESIWSVCITNYLQTVVKFRGLRPPRHLRLEPSRRRPEPLISMRASRKRAELLSPTDGPPILHMRVFNHCLQKIRDYLYRWNVLSFIVKILLQLLTALLIYLMFYYAMIIRSTRFSWFTLSSSYFNINELLQLSLALAYHEYTVHVGKSWLIAWWS